jgi:hypothetical protein
MFKFIFIFRTNMFFYFKNQKTPTLLKVWAFFLAMLVRKNLFYTY